MNWGDRANRIDVGRPVYVKGKTELRPSRESEREIRAMRRRELKTAQELKEAQDRDAGFSRKTGEEESDDSESDLDFSDEDESVIIHPLCRCFSGFSRIFPIDRCSFGSSSPGISSLRPVVVYFCCLHVQTVRSGQSPTVGGLESRVRCPTEVSCARSRETDRDQGIGIPAGSDGRE